VLVAPLALVAFAVLCGLLWARRTRGRLVWLVAPLCAVPAWAAILVALGVSHADPAALARRYLDAHLAAGAAILTAWPDVPWRGVGLAYAAAVWPYALTVGPLAGTGLWALGTLGAFKGRGGRGHTPPVREDHAEAPAFPQRVEQLAEAGAPEHTEPRRVSLVVAQITAGRRVVPGHPRDGVMLGWTPDGSPVCLFGPEYDFHAFVAGTTRMGKTNLLLHRLHPCLTRPDQAGLVIDLKGDGDLARDLGARGAVVWTMGGPRRWDPLTGTPAQVAEKLVETAGTVTGDQQNFLALGYCQALVEALDAAREPRALQTVHRLLTPDALRAFLAARVAPTRSKPAAGLLERASADARPDALEALAGRLQPLAYGDAAGALGAGPDAIDLEREPGAGRVVLLSIPALENKREAAKLGAWALIEAARVTSALHARGWKDRGNRGLIAVDEFSALGRQGDRVIGLLQRSGGFGWQVWLLTQGLSDLAAAMDKTAAQRVMNATQLNLVFRHTEPADAVAWEGYFGAYRTQEHTRRHDGETGRATGDWTTREVTRPYVPAAAIRALPRGVCYARLPGLSRPVALRVPRAIVEPCGAPSEAATAAPALPETHESSHESSHANTHGVTHGSTHGVNPLVDGDEA
jgi:hypothetical protein